MNRIYKVILGLLSVIFLLILGLHLFESNIENFLVSNARYFANYHWYMFGLAVPETIFIKLIWNKKAKRAQDPSTGEFISYALFVGLGSGVAVLGFLFSINGITILTEAYASFIQESFRKLLISSILLFISIPLAPISMFIISSPAPFIGCVKSIFKNLKEHVDE